MRGDRDARSRDGEQECRGQRLSLEALWEIASQRAFEYRRGLPQTYAFTGTAPLQEAELCGTCYLAGYGLGALLQHCTDYDPAKPALSQVFASRPVTLKIADFLPEE